MNALLMKQYRRLELVDMPSPQSGPGELLVRVHSCGICGSDVHGFDGSTGRRQPPLVMGHEAAGTVAGAGAGVAGFREGDRVTFDSTVYCGACFFCARGEVNLCDNRQVLGVSCGDYRRHGAFAEYVVAPARITYHLPDALRFEHAAMIEAVSVAVHAVGLTPVRLGDCALVLGAGMIGTLALQALKLAGCGQVIVADVDAGRLKMALALGATAVINPKEGDVAEFVREAHRDAARMSPWKRSAPPNRFKPPSRRCAKVAHLLWWVTLRLRSSYRCKPSLLASFVCSAPARHRANIQLASTYWRAALSASSPSSAPSPR